jgi:hypothetical protein
MQCNSFNTYPTNSNLSLHTISPNSLKCLRVKNITQILDHASPYHRLERILYNNCKIIMHTLLEDFSGYNGALVKVGNFWIVG